MAANSKQVGGDHYRSSIQHWDYVELNSMGYLEGCATKYVSRNRKKHEDPVVDLEKAIHYTEKLAELHQQGIRFPRKKRPTILPAQFALANGLTAAEEKVIAILTGWKSNQDLQEAVQLLRAMIREVGG